MSDPLRLPAVLALLALSLGASPPEVVRLRVPTDRVSKWLPAGTEIQGMSAAGFEALVRDAHAGSEASTGSAAPRLLRVTHSARWDDGLLVGRSELVVDPRRPDPGPFVLEPWTPAVDATDRGSSPVRSDDSGRTFLRLESAPDRGDSVKAVVHWQLAARPGSKGRKFALGLPDAGACELNLDLPDGLEPEGPAGLRRGPDRVGGRARWVFVGPTGRCELRLSETRGKADPPDAASLWVEGPTRVDVTESEANWVLDWSVSGGPQAESQLLVSLDPGLDVVTVDGAGVDDFRTEPAPDGSTRLTVRLRGPVGGAGKGAATRVSVRAMAKVPSEGRWVVPAARPVNAVWTGGTTAVRIDPSRVIEAVHPLAGRRTASPAGEPAEDHRLDFAAERPAPVAGIVFRKPRPDASAEVRGVLVVGTTSPRLTCRVTWTFHRGRPLGLEVDLPRAWVADRVDIEGSDDAASWHPEDLPDGGSRVHVASPTGDWAGRSLVLNLSAISSVAGGRGPLALPRVRPAGARLSDEVWAARVDSGMTLRPTRARGLAWLDPAAVAATVPGEPAPAPPAEAVRPALAWRWTADDAEARVERERSDSARLGSVGLIATVAPDRLTLDARVAVVSRDEPVRSITLGLTEPVGDPEAWRFFEETTGLELPGIPLPFRDLAAAGGLGRGPAWRIDLPHPQQGRLALTAHYEGHWVGHGRIPLIVLPAELRARGTFLALAGRGVRTSAVAENARVLDPEVAAESLAVEGGPAAETALTSSRRRAHAFLYDTPAARIELRADALTPAATPGVIREALLTTLIDPRGGPDSERLTLRVAPDASESLGVRLPPGSALERVARDGQPVTPTRAGETLSIPLSATSLSRPLVVVTLDYRLAGLPTSDPSVRRPVRPVMSMPCLSLAWEVVLPDPWAVAEWGPALTPADPSATRPGLLERLAGGRSRGAWGWLGRFGKSSGRDGADDVMLREFTKRLAAGRPEETSLGEWLTRLDAGRWPIVVDRVALASAGWGPRSRVVPPRVDASRPAPVPDPLRPLGLSVEPVGRTLLVTTRDGSAEDRERPTHLASALSRAAAWGSDASDRFQTVTRWREEAMPRLTSAESPESPAQGVGRTVRRYFATGWPDTGAEVRLVDRRRQAAWSWVVALAVLTPGLALRGLSRAARSAGGAGLVALGLLATAGAPVGLSGAATGLMAGSVALALIGLGESLPAARRFRRRDPRSVVSSLRGRGSNLAAPSLLVLAVAAAAATPWALAEAPPPADPGGPILALFPFDGPPDPSRAPDRVLLRLSDEKRLRALAVATAAVDPATLEAVEARHQVGWLGDRRDVVVVKTDLTLAGRGRGPTRWTFPVEDAREITATLDAVNAPVRVEAGARFGSVRIDLAGGDRTYRLALRRLFSPRSGDWGESISVAVNPVATARVEVDGHPAGLTAEVPCARGRVLKRGAAEGPAGWLGPAPRLDVRWSPPGGEISVPSAGSVSGLYLWDALPSGDRVLARLTYHDAGGTGVIRLGLDPGVLVREWTIPGVVDVSREGTPGRPEWVARIDPPLPDGGLVSLDVVRPRDEVAGPETDRTAPRIEPLGVERASVVLAFRRPPDWVGRVAPTPGALAVGDEAFVRLWDDPLPAEPLTLSGAVKLATLDRVPFPVVSTGPAPARFRVQPRVNLTVLPGRIDLSLDADLTEAAGPVHDVEVACPEGFRVVRVAADGLTDWSVAPAPATALRLRFDGPSLHRRRARVEGWVAVANDPFASGAVASSREVNVPWPRWVGQDEQAGVLTVASPTRSSLVRSTGSTVVSTEPGPWNRVTYRVTRPDDLGRLRWEVEPPRVAVTVQSQLTIDPDTTEWVAVLRYEVSDGPLDAINLKLPTEWARSASVWLDGVPHHPQTESRRDPETRRETTYWSIRPDRPVWGSQRLIVRSWNPSPADEVRSFPDLSPLGWGGAVDTSLRIANATHRPIAIEGSPGLQPVAPQAAAVDGELAASALRASSITSYHVIKSGWSLRVQKSGGPDAEGGPRADHGEIACTVAPDGSVIGLGRYEFAPRAGPFLGVELPEGSSPLWASVNGTPSRPLIAGPGRWQIPLHEESASQVALLWRSDPPARRRDGSAYPIPLPAVGRGLVPVVVTVRAAAGVDVSSPNGRLNTSGVDRVELEKAGWLGRETAEALSGLDRGSRREGENLVAALIRFELLLRRAERASAYEPFATPDQREERISQTGLVAGRLRDRLAEALRTEALDEFETAARAHLGLTHEPAGSPIAPSSETPLPVQVRPLGRPRSFQGAVDSASRTPWLVWAPEPDSPSADRYWLIGLAVLAATAPPLAWRLAGRSSRPRRLARLVLIVSLALTAYWAGPVWLAAGSGFAVLGRFTRH